MSEIRALSIKSYHAAHSSLLPVAAEGATRDLVEYKGHGPQRSSSSACVSTTPDRC